MGTFSHLLSYCLLWITLISLLLAQFLSSQDVVHRITCLAPQMSPRPWVPVLLWLED
jgi:hypothetical protein